MALKIVILTSNYTGDLYPRQGYRSKNHRPELLERKVIREACADADIVLAEFAPDGYSVLKGDVEVVEMERAWTDRRKTRQRPAKHRHLPPEDFT